MRAQAVCPPAPLLKRALDGLDEAGASYCLIVSYEQGTAELISNTGNHEVLAAVLRSAADQVDAGRRAVAN